jgi:hypothetical protein
MMIEDGTEAFEDVADALAPDRSLANTPEIIAIR